ncbi:MAG: helix-turn-helix transcriptional regulator [Myxococcota bacterium]
MDLNTRIDDVLRAARAEEALGALLGLVQREVPCVGVMHYQYTDVGMQPVRGSLAPLFNGVDAALFTPASDPTHRIGAQLTPRPRIVCATCHPVARPFDRSLAYDVFYRSHQLRHLTCLWLTRRPYASPGFQGLLIARAPQQGELRPDEIATLQVMLPVLVATTPPMKPPAPAAPGGVRFDPDGNLREPLDAVQQATWKQWGLSARECVRITQAWPYPLGWSRRLIPHPRRRAALEVSIRRQVDGSGELTLHSPQDARVCEALRHHGLTFSEMIVIQALADGFETDEIAQRLFISTGTVRTHLKRVFRKFGVRSRVRAALMMQRLLLSVDGEQGINRERRLRNPTP